MNRGSSSPPPAYPAAPTADVVDDYHGTPVADPYRWLEDPDAPATRDWIGAQNRLTQGWLAEVEQRAGLRRQLRLRWDVPRRGAPWRRGSWWFQLRNTGLQDQDVLWVAADISGPPEDDGAWQVLLDPNALSEEGTTSLSAFHVTRDGRLAAYATSDAGSDWMTWRVLEVPSGHVRDDVVTWSKFSTAAWTGDGGGFFYAAYDPPGQAEALRAANRDQKLWFHRLGTSQDADVLVYARPDEPEWGFLPWVSRDGRWLVVTVWRGTDPQNRIYVADLGEDASAEVPTDLTPVLDAGDASYDVVAVRDGQLVLRTDLDAPRGRIVRIPLGSGPVEITELVPETAATLEDVRLAGGESHSEPLLVGLCLEDAHHRLRRWRVDGSPLDDLDLPSLGSVGALATAPDDLLVHVTFATFTTPSAVLRFDGATGDRSVVFDPTAVATPAGSAGIDRPEATAVTEQVWVTSADGTRVPMFLVHRAGVTPGTGPHPTLLWGYGGFNIPITPMYRTPWAVWVARGGVLAVPNLRGGGEFGRDWHDAGRLANKQHTFDDAIAAAEWLTAQGWTTPQQLAVSGGSNGGLLVGACITQRPELFGAAVAEVGVLDLLRFHRFTIGWGWRSDYGDPDDPAGFAVLRAYSPLHNLRPGTAYPATLLLTGDHDDRVVPAHSFKFAAALQAAQGADAPILIRVETDAGHGAGKPTTKIIDERTDVLAFLVRAIGDPGG
jgi:prolyl oligopeptidase